MIGLTVKQVQIGRYAENSIKDFYFDGTLEEAFALVKKYEQHDKDWYQVACGISNVRLLPDDVAKFSNELNLYDLRLLTTPE